MAALGRNEEAANHFIGLSLLVKGRVWDISNLDSLLQWGLRDSMLSSRNLACCLVGKFEKVLFLLVLRSRYLALRSSLLRRDNDFVVAS